MSFRRFSKTLCVIGLAASYTFTTYGATLTDVTSSHWAYSSIVNLEGKGIISLNSSGQFFPNQIMDYFEAADVLAKATGYVDADVATNADATLVAQIKANYEKQKSTINTYVAKYSQWNSAYNQQIAYLLGRGYLTTSDLDKFITKSGNKEVTNAITKEDLSIFVVRVLGKAVTAENSYKSTGFKDEQNISEAARPYMAYLKDVGILSADASGNGNGKAKVTKALCAKIVDSALQLKDNSATTTPTQPSVPSTSEGVRTASVKKVLTKNTTEYYLILQIGDSTSYYTIKNTTKITDTNGNEVAITKLAGETLYVTTAMEGSTEYVTSAKVIVQASTNEQVQPTLPEVNTNTETSVPTTDTVTNDTIISGILSQVMTNGICRIQLVDGTNKTYILDGDCTITLNGVNVDQSEIAIGDTVILTAESGIITNIQATSGSTSQLSNGEVTEKKLANGAYNLTIKQNGREATIIVPDTAAVMRNTKVAEMADIRLGDTISVTKVNGVISEVKATSKRSTVEGTINQIIIGSTVQVVLNVNGTPTTYTIAQDAEIYDLAEAEVISVRDLHLGQKATLLLDSKEVISLDIDSKANSFNLMGTINRVGKKVTYIDVLVDYDYITNESKVYKRIALTDDVKVVVNGKVKDIYELEDGMSVLINYEYLDDAMPQKITVLS